MAARLPGTSGRVTRALTLAWDAFQAAAGDAAAWWDMAAAAVGDPVSRKLKPAQIAGLLEDASKDEGTCG